ncbi:MAG: hypothetical protein JETT_0030 [Candidatus Jettenia ecosi]|uniref:Uncharacterized protein n=1 Tax=Candidatus Jettenia ecosi TaxID=2494326 RepID=A0A533QG13_9BACT|nr:MAG: hypothetical protein JETT_0030 [Candidatus Jettenia ecosi]
MTFKCEIWIKVFFILLMIKWLKNKRKEMLDVYNLIQE